MGFYAAIPFFANLSFTSKFIKFSLILFFSSSFTVGRERQRVRERERELELVKKLNLVKLLID